MTNKITIDNLEFNGPYDIEKDKIEIPKKCGIYIYYDINMEVMYIGKASNLNSRYNDHKNTRTSKVGLAKVINNNAIKYYSYSVTEMIEDAEMYEMIYTRLKNPVLAKIPIKEIAKETVERYKESYIEYVDTSLPIPKTKQGDIRRTTIRVDGPLMDEFNKVWRGKYSEYKQHNLLNLALQIFIDKYK